MSIQFSDPTNLKGLAQLYATEIGYKNPAEFTNNTTYMKQFAADVNLAMDDFFAIAIPASGTWQLDDSNHGDYPIIKTNIVSGQRDYTFTTDGSGNLILDIYRVAILPSATATLYEEIYPIDAQSDVDTVGLVQENATTGVPYRYDKTSNGIFFDPIPSYNATNGLKMYINRESSYFAYTDTTKKPGVPGLFHKYFYLKPAAENARRNNLSNAAKLMDEVAKMEGVPGRAGSIAKYFGFRARDERKQLTMSRINFR